MRRLEMAAAVRGWALGLCLCAAATGCFDTRSGAQTGGETHFMQACDGRCPGELACVCGVCTRACDGDDACSALAEDAVCAAVDADGEACAGANASEGAGANEGAGASEGAGAIESAGAATGVPARVCSVACERDGECAEFGDRFVCASGVCRTVASVEEPEPPLASDAGAVPPLGGDVDAGCSGTGCAVAVEQPLVVLVVDSSGSMERKGRCACTSAGCVECLPNCSAGERSRWIELIQALGGTLEGYGCEQLDRTEENGATFDLGYFTPYHRPLGTPGDDGVLDTYRDSLRFGLATFDGMDTYVGATAQVPTADFDLDRSASVDGLWSYNPIRALGRLVYTETGGLLGAFNYPGCETAYYMDTGVRGPHAEQGALRIASALDRLEVNDRIQRDLLATRPYGGTPIAGALTDLYYYLAGDPLAAAERASAMPRHVVLITDGEPDSDYRNDRCNCAAEGDAPDRCGALPVAEGVYDAEYDPATKTCPLPTAEKAARLLRCGDAWGERCEGPAARVHVVGFAVDAPEIRTRLERIAIEGGPESAHFAQDGAELRAQLAAIFDEILAR